MLPAGRFINQKEKIKNMYAMTGKLTVHTGKRNALVEILLQASDVVAQLPGCLLLILSMRMLLMR